MHTYSRRCPRGALVTLFTAALVTLMPVGVALAQAEREATPTRGPDRSGFTLLLTMGLGLQSNEFIDESTAGLGGLNLGIGGFVSPDLAVMFRATGTNVTFDDIGFFSTDVEVVSGAGGVSVQYWPSDFVNLEGGVGFGFANSDPGTDERGFGLILGAGFSFFHRAKNSLQVGVEYAPVFLDGGNVHNVSIAFGWQLL